MVDYGQMRRTLRTLNERIRGLDGMPCPRGCCFGTLRRRGSGVACDSCSSRSPLSREFAPGRGVDRR